MSAVFFSIIIPTFNSHKTLRNALDSIVGQEFKKWEIIIIDGLSTDSTLNIIREYSDFDSRIRSVSEKDKGIYDAMNKGIKMARGQWVYFLGGDDSLYDKHVLQQVAGKLGECSCDFFYGNVLMANNVMYAGSFTKERLLKVNISHQAIFYKSGLFEKIGNYNTRFRLHADWDFNIRCFESPDVNIQYSDMLIARFGAGGVSFRHDIIFLREDIIHLRAKELHQKREKLSNIRIYDEWWRLLRNARIRKIQELQYYAGQSDLPPALKKMIKFQRLFPQNLLRAGLLSKSLMFIHFCFSGNKRPS